MNMDKLKDLLDKDLANYNTFLVDGNWGIGKSTFILKYLKNKKYIYLSLFGVKDSKELENNLFLELKNSSDMINRLCQFYEPYNIKTNSFKLEFNNTITDDLFIVLDDIEKKSDMTTYKELFGLINALKELNRVNVICICDSSKIGINNIDVFNSLTTLVIDKCYYINSISKDSINDIISSNYMNKPNKDIISNEKFDNYLYSFIDKYKIKNLRTINKMISFSGLIINNIDTSKLSKGDIQNIVNICFGIIVEKYDHYIFENDKLVKIIVSEYLSNIIYPIDKEELVVYILNLINDQEEYKYDNINKFFDIVRDCKSEKNEVKLFFMSPDKIEKIITKFIKSSIIKYNNKLSIDEWFNKLYEYYFYSKLIDKKYLFKEDEIIYILDEYINSIKCADISLFNINLKIRQDKEVEELNNITRILKDKIIYKYFMYYYDNLCNDFKNNIYDSRKIADLITFVLGTDFKNNDDIDTVISLLRNKELFIPDLDSEVDENTWNYVHEIWKGISTTSDSQNKKKMLNLLIQVSNDKYQTASSIGKYRISSLNEYYNILQL